MKKTLQLNHRSRRNSTLLALLAASIFVLSSCEKKEGDKEPDTSTPLSKIEGSVENSAAAADSIRAVATLNGATYHVASSAISADGKFSIPLPDLKNAKFLYPITEYPLIRKEVYEYVNDTAAQMVKLQFYSVKNGQVIGQFYFADSPSNSPLTSIGDKYTRGEFLYFDRSVSVGPIHYNNSISYDLMSLRQGWHIIYYRLKVYNASGNQTAIHTQLFSVPCVGSSYFEVNKDDFEWYFLANS
jgi:hypothetical protein